MRKLSHKFDFCVVGGGMAGICAAISAAREGAKVAIVQNRPMFGGNASSEIRVHVCGADRHGKIPNVRETGILEEGRLENLSRNPQRSFSIWDTVLFYGVKPHHHHEDAEAMSAWAGSLMLVLDFWLLFAFILSLALWLMNWNMDMCDQCRRIRFTAED